MLNVEDFLVDVGPGYSWVLSQDEKDGLEVLHLTLRKGGMDVDEGSFRPSDATEDSLRDIVDRCVGTARVAALVAQIGTYEFSHGEVRFRPADEPAPKRKPRAEAKDKVEAAAKARRTLAPHRPGYGFQRQRTISDPDDEGAF